MKLTNPLTQQPVTDDQLKSISQLVELQLRKEAQINAMEEALEELKNEHKQLSEQQIPDAMMEIGMSSFTLHDGTKVQVDKFYSGSISDEHRVEAFKWLRGHGYETLIKREIKCNFGKGEDGIASKVVSQLTKMKIGFNDKESVHPQTLKSFIRESVENGRELPMDLLGVYIGSRTKLTKPN